MATNHARINAMEQELDIPLSVWDDPEPKGSASAAQPRMALTTENTTRIAKTQDVRNSGAVASAQKVKTTQAPSKKEDVPYDAQLSEKGALHFRPFTLAELVNFRESMIDKPKLLGVLKLANEEIVRRIVASQPTAEGTEFAANPAAAARTGEKIPISQLSDDQLSNLNAYFTKNGPSEDFTTTQFHSVLAEIVQRATAKKVASTDASTEKGRPGTSSTVVSSASGQMTMEIAIAQAKAEGYDYDKAVSSHYQTSLKYSPLELRIEKKTYDAAAQTKFAKGDYDMAVVFSAHSMGIQQALEEKGGVRTGC